METFLIGDIWYRYDGTYHKQESGTRVYVYLSEYKVTRVLPATVELDDGAKRLVLKVARRRFAYPTKELAFASFVHRTRWRVGYAETAFFVANTLRDAIEPLLAKNALPEDFWEITKT